MHRRFAIYIALVLAVSVMPGRAQTPTGTITGQVIDPSGASIPGANVSITNASTNENKELKTDSGGRYVAPFLTPGAYSVEVKADGFRPVKQQNIAVEVGITRPIDFTLSVGNVSSTVEVESTTPPLDTETSTVGQVVSTKEVLDLPLNGRNPFSLAELVPGVNNVGNASTPHIGGSRNAVNEEQIDGVTNILPENNVGNTTGAYTPVVDSVQEFNISVNALSAEYGRFGGGVINVATKSGTNSYHGDGFFFARNAVFDARNFFSPNVPDMYRYQSGGTLGGPVIIPGLYNGRDKTFFFFGFQDQKEHDFASANETVPTALERTGDFSQSGVQIFDPTTAHQDASGNWIRSPFATNNVIPANLLNPVALKAITYFPMPNTVGNGYNYTATGVSVNNDDKWDARIDENFTDKWHMFLRFSHDWNDSAPLADYGNAASTGWGGPATGGAWSASMDHTYTFSPTLIGDFRYGISRSYVTRTPYGNGFDPATLGLSSITSVASGEDLQFPRFDFGGFNNIQGLGANGYVYLVENPFAHDVTANLTKIAGAHTIKAGGEYRKLYINFTQYGDPDGYFQFSTNWTQQNLYSGNGTGDPLASFLLGLPDGNGSSYITHDPTAASSSQYMAYYIQDDWKVTRRFTVNLGLRWDVEFPRTERYNRLSYWNPNLTSPLQGLVPANACLYCGDLRGQLVFVNGANSQYGRSQAPTQWKDFGPRVGFAYNVTDKTVIRSGFGIAYLPSALEAAGTSGASGMVGFASTTNVQSTFDNYQTIHTTLSNPFPAGFNLPTGTALGGSTYLGESISDVFFDSYRNPYTIQWNFNIERQLPGQITISAGYIGNHSLFLVNGDPGVPYSQVSPTYLPLGNQLLQQVPNPFYGIITDPNSPLSQKTVAYNQLLSPYPQYSSVSAFRKPDGASRYNALLLSANKRFSNGLDFMVSFTGSKLMDNSGAAVTYLGPTSGTYTDQYNGNLQWSVSPQDISKNFTASFLYELPFGHGRQFANSLPRLANLAISGWSVNGIVQASTGTPVIISGANSNTGLKTVYSEPADNNGQSAALSHPTIQEWFNTSVFSNPAPFTFGDTSRTLPDVRNPGVVNADLSLFKNNYFGAEDHYNVQLRLESFNALNHAQFAAPNSNVNAGAGFGTITSTANNNREIQLAVKFIF